MYRPTPFQRLVSIVSIHPTTARYQAKRLLGRARRYLKDGRLQEAIYACHAGLTLTPNSTKLHNLLASALMPGEDYLAVLTRFHQVLCPESYVEIGTGKGASLARALPKCTAVAVDPFPRIQEMISARAKVYPVQSDVFFERYDLRQELGLCRLGLVFLDGLHDFSQALRDFINIERFADDATIVLVHDCVPVSRMVAGPSRQISFWCGTAWKLLPFLAEHRPDLRICIIPTRPSGLGMVTGLDSTSTVLEELASETVPTWEDSQLSYDVMSRLGPRLFGVKLIENGWSAISSEIADRP